MTSSVHGDIYLSLYMVPSLKVAVRTTCDMHMNTGHGAWHTVSAHWMFLISLGITVSHNLIRDQVIHD